MGTVQYTLLPESVKMRRFVSFLRNGSNFRAQHRTLIPETQPKAIGGSLGSSGTAANIQEPVKKVRLVVRVKNFWLGVKNDYTEALKDFKNEAVAKPVKSSIYSALIGFAGYCWIHNPDEESFKDSFMTNGLDLSLIGDPIRNPRSQNLHDYVSKAFNAGLIRRLNLRVCSIIWVDDYHSGLGLWAARCDLLQPSYLDIVRHRVVDIGFLGRWWISSGKMEECDVNFTEWTEDGRPTGTQLKPLW